jgi:hypothetical protein
MERLFHEKARSSNGCGACSPECGRQCPGVECPDGQRQGPTAAAGRDEGVTSPSPVISAQGRLRAGPVSLSLRLTAFISIWRDRQQGRARLVAVATTVGRDVAIAWLSALLALQQPSSSSTAGAAGSGAPANSTLLPLDSAEHQRKLSATSRRDPTTVASLPR